MIVTMSGTAFQTPEGGARDARSNFAERMRSLVHADHLPSSQIQ
jgi:hypothetical protein